MDGHFYFQTLEKKDKQLDELRAKLKEQETVLEQQQNLLTKLKSSSRKNSTITPALSGTPIPHAYHSPHDPKLTINTSSRPSSLSHTSKAATPAALHTNSPKVPLIQPSRLEASLKASRLASNSNNTNSFVVATTKPAAAVTTTNYDQQQQQPVIDAMSQYFSHFSNNGNTNHLIQQSDSWSSLASYSMNYHNYTTDSEASASKNMLPADQFNQATAAASVGELASMLVTPSNYHLGSGPAGLFTGEYLTQIPDARSAALAPNVNIGLVASASNQLSQHAAATGQGYRTTSSSCNSAADMNMTWRYHTNEYNNTTMQYPARHTDINQKLRPPQ